MTAIRQAPSGQPSAAPSARFARLATPGLWAMGMLAAVAVLHVRDPHQIGSYAFCPWLVLTGSYCPGCGGLRAVNDLSHGDVGGAVSSNLLVVALVPVAVLLWVSWVRSRWRGEAFASPLFAGPVLWSLFAVLLGFGLLRNLDIATWLAP